MSTYSAKNTLYKIMKIQTVLIIETVHIILSWTTLRLYGTYNRVILKKIQTVLIIESVLIIERKE